MVSGLEFGVRSSEFGKSPVIQSPKPPRKRRWPQCGNDMGGGGVPLRREAEKPHHRPTQGQPKCCPYRRPGGDGGRPSPATTRGDANHCCFPSNIWCAWHLQVYRLGLTSLPQYIMGLRRDSTWAVLALGLSWHLG